MSEDRKLSFETLAVHAGHKLIQLLSHVLYRFIRPLPTGSVMLIMQRICSRLKNSVIFILG